MPVTITTSPRWSASRSVGCSGTSVLLDLAGGGVDGHSLAGGRTRGHGVTDGLNGAETDAGHHGEFLDGGRPELAERAEVLEQRLAAYVAEPGHVVEHALDHGPGPTVAVVGDGE